MITLEERERAWSCRGRGFNCKKCCEKNGCLDYIAPISAVDTGKSFKNVLTIMNDKGECFAIQDMTLEDAFKKLRGEEDKKEKKEHLINLGNLVSLIHCKKCDMPIEIYPSQESIICPNCKKIINLKHSFN